MHVGLNTVTQPTEGAWWQVVSEEKGQKRGVAPSQTSAHMTQLIMPQYANSLGITFGGQARAAACCLSNPALLSVVSCCGHGSLFCSSHRSPCLRPGVVCPSTLIVAELLGYLPGAPTHALLSTTSTGSQSSVSGLGNAVLSARACFLRRRQVMKWMEQCAYIAASRVGRGGGHLLTASMDSIAFASPTRVGDIMYISAQVHSMNSAGPTRLAGPGAAGRHRKAAAERSCVERSCLCGCT